MKKYLVILLAVVVVLLAIVFAGKREADAEQTVVSRKMEEAREKLQNNGRPADSRQIIPGTQTRQNRFRNKREALEEAELDELLALLESEDEERMIETMRTAQHLSAADKLKFADAALSRVKDPDFRLDALGMVEGMSTKKIVPILQKAAMDEDVYVRKNAIAALANFDFSREDELKEEISFEETKLDAEIEGEDEEAKQKLQDLYEEFLTLEDKDALASLLINALNDADEEVRAQAMDVIEQMEADIQYVAIEAALNSKHEEMQLDALAMMTAKYNKDNFPLILEAMNSPHQGVADRATGMVEHILGQHFASPSAAADWWKENNNKFGYEMEELQDGVLDVK